MRGLFIKDFYSVIPQIKIFLVMGVVMALISSGEMVPYIVLYASMLSMTAMAYDEQCRWNVLAKMMPYSVFDTVLCKYLLGGAVALIMGALCFASQLVFGVVLGRGSLGAVLLMQVLYFSAAMILQAINLPLMFLFGVEKGRIWLLLFNVAAVVFAFEAGEELLAGTAGGGFSLLALAGLGALLAAALSAVSVFLSVRFYEKISRRA